MKKAKTVGRTGTASLTSKGDELADKPAKRKRAVVHTKAGLKAIRKIETDDEDDDKEGNNEELETEEEVLSDEEGPHKKRKKTVRRKVGMKEGFPVYEYQDPLPPQKILLDYYGNYRLMVRKKILPSQVSLNTMTRFTAVELERHRFGLDEFGERKKGFCYELGRDNVGSIIECLEKLFRLLTTPDNYQVEHDGTIFKFYHVDEDLEFPINKTMRLLVRYIKDTPMLGFTRWDKYEDTKEKKKKNSKEDTQPFVYNLPFHLAPSLYHALIKVQQTIPYEEVEEQKK